MRAVDTNVVVRVLADDDVEQTDRAVAAILAGDVFVSLTVLLECEWVLRRGYRYESKVIAEVLRGFVGMPGVTAEEPALFAQALDWMEAGMDFADALHLAKAANCSVFLSFDRKLAKAAHGRSSVPVEEP